MINPLSSNKEEFEQIQRNERLIRVRETLRNRGEKLTEEEYQAVKAIFHDVPQLDFVPKTLWLSLANIIELKEVPKGEKLVSRDEPNPPCCIILSGRFQVVFYGDSASDSPREKLLFPGDVCGNFQYFAGKHWRPADFVSLEQPSSAAMFETAGLAKLLAAENSNQQFKVLLGFLTESIPGFEHLSGHLKERLSRFFKEVTFLPGKEIIQEGTVPSAAYLVKEGTCSIISSQNPIFHPSLQSQIKVPPDPKLTPLANASVYKTVNTILSPAKSLRGYMSLSTNIYQLRTVSEKEWLGEETLLCEKGTTFCYEYSVIARTKVIALEITRENLKKFPSSLLEWFTKNAQNKNNWHGERKAELAASIGKIYNMDPLTSFLDEALVQVTKKFPQASPQLTTQLHKHNFLSQDDSQDLSEIAAPPAPAPLSPTQKPPQQKLVRPKSGVLPTFNNLRSLMKTKKQAVAASGAALHNKVSQRPMTAAQTMPAFHNGLRTATAGAAFGIGYRSAANFFARTATASSHHPQQQRPKTSYPAAGGTASQYQTILSARSGPQKVFLEAASTFKMTYDNKASLPRVVKIPPPTKTRVIVIKKEEHNDSKVEKMKLEIETMYDTFKVGLRDVKALEPDSRKRPPSPNPAKIWANKRKVDFGKLNEEVKAMRDPPTTENEEAASAAAAAAKHSARKHAAYNS